MSAAERVRRHRERARAGKRMVPVEIDAALVEDALTRSGLLSRTAADDPPAVAEALARAVDEWSRETIARHLAESQ